MRTRVSSKGQVVIPAELRKKYGMKPGTALAVIDTGDAIELRPITPQTINKMRGSLKGGSALKELLEERRKDREREDRKRE